MRRRAEAHVEWDRTDRNRPDLAEIHPGDAPQIQGVSLSALGRATRLRRPDNRR
jgi:hypothetical protein